MTLTEVLQHFDGVTGRNGQYKARCPAHPDKKASLSIKQGDKGGIVLHCFAGCDNADILGAAGLTQADINPPKADKPAGKRIVAIYSYTDDAGKMTHQKIRYSDKSFTWRQPKGDGWQFNRNGIAPTLYASEKPLPDAVFLVEGEKDVDTLKACGVPACSVPNGAKSKWEPQFTDMLRGKEVYIIPDNDAPGMELAKRAAKELKGAAKCVKLLDLKRIWPEIPEKGDASDLIAHMGKDDGIAALVELIRDTPDYIDESDEFLSKFKTLDEFPEEEAKWFIPGWIPAGQISLISADGGVGKTTLWCHIIAARSNGKGCILDPPGFECEPMKILFLTTEDSIRKKLRRKLRLAGANMKNIIAPDFVGDKSGLIHKLKFGTAEMEKMLRHFTPALCVFDPLQGFIPPRLNMGSRNEMRDCIAPMISIGEEVETTPLIVSHTNKRKGAYGRDRIADSADLWDIARSVMMAGFTEEQGVCYLSNEKNNYAPLQETILFKIDENGQIQRVGTSWKRDREYVQEADIARSPSRREDCAAYLMKVLNDAGGEMPTSELDAQARAAGYSFASIKRAKTDLNKEGSVKYYQTGSTRDGTNQWHAKVIGTGFRDVDSNELPKDTKAPFEWVSPSDT